MSPKIFDILRSLKIDQTGEIQLADAIDKYARTGLVESLLANGIRFDCGSQDGYVRAVVADTIDVEFVKTKMMAPRHFYMIKITIIGGAGFVGTFFCKILNKKRFLLKY